MVDVSVLTGAGGTLILGVLGWWSKVRLDRRSGEIGLMEQQRADFLAQLAPLRADVASLKTRVGELESEVRRERDLRERLVDFTRDLLWEWKRRFPDHPPPTPPPSLAPYFD